MGPATRALASRAAQALVTLLLASVAIFCLLSLAPGDPAQRLVAARGITDPSYAQLSAIRHELGLDQPLPVRYVRWIARAVHGDLGRSFASGQPVTTELGERLPATIRLALVGFGFALAIAIPAALVAASLEGSWVDAALRSGAIVASALPSFVAGLLLVRFVIIGLGVGHVISDGSWHQALLPGLCLGLLPGAQLSRLLRAGLVDELSTQAAFVARARGATRLRILIVHALPNAALPFLTTLGVTLAYLFTGAAVIEAVFTWPGVGQYLVAAVDVRDVPVIEGFTLLATAAFVLTSFTVDLAASVIDPRLRSGSRR